ncbi:MAG: PQQ-binding-like beta-propeller repeat protein [candidate division WOR-3 bacterium]
MKSKNMLPLVAAAVILALLGLGCPKSKAPSTPVIASAPESTWINATTPVRVFCTAPGNKDVRYVVDLGQPDNRMDTSDVTTSGDTTYIYPKWTQTGTFSFKVAAYLDEDPTKISEFSESKSIRVLPNSPPQLVWFSVPPMSAKNVETEFKASAVDPENDSIEFYFDFGDGTKKWFTDQRVASGETVTVYHKYDQVDTFWVKIKARDWKRSESDPDSSKIIIGLAGRVLWAFVGPTEDSEPPVASPVIVDTLIYTYCEDGYIYSVRMGSGRKQSQASSPRGTDPDDYYYNGHPAYCQSTGHIIIGSDDAFLYALNASNLNRAWSWSPTDTVNPGWGTPAINGDKIYIASDADTLYYLQDAVSSCSRLGAYALPAPVSGAPVIDRSGNVIVALENGMLYRFTPTLALDTVLTIRQGTALTSPVLDEAGVIYVGDDSGYVTAVNENGSIRWTQMVDPAGISGMAVGVTRLYVGTGLGKLVALNLADGQTAWTNTTCPNSVVGSPALAANGYLYFMDDDDNLYCISQTDGAWIWTAQCFLQVGGRARHSGPRRLEVGSNPSLTIAPNGNIIVVGENYMYCVLGYSDGTLHTGAPWPKWQKDLYNTGKK